MIGLDCIQLLKDGEREGLGCLYKLFAEDLYRYGVAICGNTTLVEECLHDFFVYIWEKRKKFENVENPKSYLMISYKRRLIKKLAKAKDYEPLNFDYEVNNQQESAEEQIIQEEQEEEFNVRLSEAMKHLSKKERQAIHLKYFERYKNEEIAELLNIANQSVRNLLYRAIQNLRKKL
ncbi:RNA polymerase sigma factor [Portibacter marinus]|uniref:RNA polymerase sigma factor n=1 Tax=Portibacter marinus TaxID=2898660 RepID=UPI001F18CC82|nr:sigma-70 family RNA polymerase sigma factor [Portibacter marinus]